MQARHPRPSTLMAILLLASACGAESPSGSPAAIPDPPLWAVAAEPDVSIGVVDGDPMYQMHGVVGAMRLDDGRIAVMNAGSGQLRIYGTDGTIISSHGRPGEGPGEFRRASSAHLIGDTIFIYDSGLQRFSLHDLTGAFLENRRFRPTRGRFELDAWLYDRSWINGPPLGVGRGLIMEAVGRLPLPDSIDLFRYVDVSPYGQLWVRERSTPDAAVVPWRVYDMGGVPVGRAHLPLRFEVLDYGQDYLLGRNRDDLDVEYVQLLRLEPTERPQQRLTFTASAADTMRLLDADTAFEQSRTEIVGALRMLNMAQEVFYSAPANDYQYATHTSQLPDYEMPEGAEIRIVTANERGWSAVAVHEASGRMCGMGVGLVTPPGWVPGTVACQ